MQRREGGRIQEEAGRRGQETRRQIALPEHQHHQVLRIGELQRRQHLAVQLGQRPGSQSRARQHSC